MWWAACVFMGEGQCIEGAGGNSMEGHVLRADGHVWGLTRWSYELCTGVQVILSGNYW